MVLVSEVIGKNQIAKKFNQKNPWVIRNANLINPRINFSPYTKFPVQSVGRVVHAV